MTNQPASNDSSRAGSARKTRRRPRTRRCPGLQVRCCQDGSELVRRPVAEEWLSVSANQSPALVIAGERSFIAFEDVTRKTAGLTHDHGRDALPGGVALI